MPQPVPALISPTRLAVFRQVWAARLHTATLRDIALAVALAVYALYGSPTPAVIGWPETVIALCLLVAIIPRRPGMPPPSLMACFLTLLVPLTVVGLTNGHPPGDVLRDIIPLGFFFLPLFLAPNPESGPATARILYHGLIAVGVVFAWRFWPTSGINILRFGEDRSDEKFLYLSNSPTLLYAGLALLFAATTIDRQLLAVRSLAFMGSLLCLSVLALTLQRGALLFGAVAVAGVFWHRTLRTPHFLFTLFVTGGVLAVLCGPAMLELLNLVWAKTVSVGDNARLAELTSVTDLLGDDPLSWLWGKGWGAKVTTAASGHAEVRYTHGLLAYALLKGGMIGLLAITGYGVYLGRAFVRAAALHPVPVMAALPSFLLGFTVYPSFKMLCFGAMLALVTLLANPRSSDAAAF